MILYSAGYPAYAKKRRIERYWQLAAVYLKRGNLLRYRWYLDKIRRLSIFALAIAAGTGCLSARTWERIATGVGHGAAAAGAQIHERDLADRVGGRRGRQPVIVGPPPPATKSCLSKRCKERGESPVTSTDPGTPGRP